MLKEILKVALISLVVSLTIRGAVVFYNWTQIQCMQNILERLN